MTPRWPVSSTAAPGASSAGCHLLLVSLTTKAWVSVEAPEAYDPPALQLPADAHDTELMPAFQAGVEGGRAGYLLGRLPPAAGLADHEHLLVAGSVEVVAACGAVARRRTRHRLEDGGPALVEDGRARHLLSRLPPPAGLVDHERLGAGPVEVVATCAAVARRRARQRLDEGGPAPVEGGGAGRLFGRLPGAAASRWPRIPAGARTRRRTSRRGCSCPPTHTTPTAMAASRPWLSAAVPGASSAGCQAPAVSVATNACSWPGPSA